MDTHKNSLGDKASNTVGSLGVLAPRVLAHGVHGVVVDAVILAVSAHEHGERCLQHTERKEVWLVTDVDSQAACRQDM